MWANISRCLKGFAIGMNNNIITNDSPLKQKDLIIMKIKGLANYGLYAILSLSFTFVNKVLLEHSHAHHLHLISGYCLIAKAELSSSDVDSWSIKLKIFTI